MNERIWQQLWGQSDPYLHAAVALMLLNGLDTAQIRDLHSAHIDLDGGWLTTREGCTYPLTTYAQDALAALHRDGELVAARLDAAADELAPLAAEGHRRLAGAIWITDEELQVTLESTGSGEVPLLPLRFTFPFSIVERLQAGETSDMAVRARAVLQSAATWLVEQTLSVSVPLSRRILGLLRRGSLVFVLTSTGVSGLNLIHNVLMGRLLSPADYSQLTFIITLQLLVGLLPTTIQTVIGRFTARYQAQHDDTQLDALRREIGRFGWLVGLATGVFMLLLAPILIDIFQINGVGLLLPVVVVLPFYVRMGVDRGVLQGVGAYFWLSAAYLLEGLVRLGIGVLLGYALLTVGRSLEGAVWGFVESMLATWFVSWLAVRHFRTGETHSANSASQRREWLQLGRMTALVLIGQALITNSDFLLVKNFFSSEDAGLYAAVSVLGRIVYFGALPLTILLVPLIARRQALNDPTRPILMMLIGGGAVICGLLIGGAVFFGDRVLSLLYGEAYFPGAALLAPYALAASLYTLTNLVITYQIALGSGGETWMPILAGSAQITGVLLFHDSLEQVILVQIVLMGLLFAIVLWRVLREPRTPPEADDEARVAESS